MSRRHTGGQLLPLLMLTFLVGAGWGATSAGASDVSAESPIEGVWRVVQGFHWSLRYLVIEKRDQALHLFLAEAPDMSWFQDVKRSGRRVTGKWYTPCQHPSGEVVAYYDDFQLRLSADGKRLAGQGRYQWRAANCERVEDVEFIPLVFERDK